MWTRYGGAFGMSMAMHAAVVAALVWSTWMPALSAGRQPRQIQVVLLPPSEDSGFPGLKPVERSRAGATSNQPTGEGQIAGADIDRIGGHLPVLFPFVNPGLALDAFFPSIPSSTHLLFENPYVGKPA